MVDSTPDRWRQVHSHQWYSVDDVEFITMINANGSWALDTPCPVEGAFEDAGWLLWRVPDQSVGGAFAADKVVKVVWAT